MQLFVFVQMIHTYSIQSLSHFSGVGRINLGKDMANPFQEECQIDKKWLLTYPSMEF